MTLDALKLLDRVIPRTVAAQFLGCSPRLFAGVKSKDLTLATAFAIALAAARADLDAARERRRRLKSVRKSKIIRLRRSASKRQPTERN